jgi:hypothetical protein
MGAKGWNPERGTGVRFLNMAQSRVVGRRTCIGGVPLEVPYVPNLHLGEPANERPETIRF